MSKYFKSHNFYLVHSSLYSTSPDSQSSFGTLTLWCFVFWKTNFEESHVVILKFYSNSVFLSLFQIWGVEVYFEEARYIFWEGEVYGLSSKMWHHWLSTLSPLPTHLTNIFIKHFLVNISTHWLECNFNKQDHSLFVIFARENNKMFIFILKPLLFWDRGLLFLNKASFLLVRYCQGNL